MNQLFSTVSADVDLIILVRNIFIGVILAWILGVLVERFSRVTVNRAQYKLVFALLIPTMVLVINTIKSSLALSLGLVGALSIVRFRTPIKESEELVYLFIAIAVGLGLGADQVMPTVVSFIALSLILVVWGTSIYKEKGKTMFLEVELEDIGNSRDGVITKLAQIFDNRKITGDLKRCIARNKKLSLTFYTEPRNAFEIEGLLEDIKKTFNVSSILFIDQEKRAA